MAQYQRLELSGLIFGKLTVIKIDHKKHGQYYWKCLCECGKITIVSATRLNMGSTKSCGCLRKVKWNITHGMKYTPLYSVWLGIKRRCLNKSSHNYKLYGGRGIGICDRWKDDFLNFYNDMKDGYKKGLHIGRINNNLGYFKENCQWETPTQNANNKRTNLWITYNGKTHTAAEWGRILNIKDDTICHRKKRGYTDYECLFGRLNNKKCLNI